ncbi:TPA: threonyl-tRNA synthetase [Vibrio cholerae]|uniref:threonyl-tRNA synthetase n=1 Tax=Vibrio cholerae TaxID=666 RepID=UPI002FDC4831
MDKVMLIPSATLGLVLVALYLWRCWKTGTVFNHAVMINTVFQASGIVCGLFLIAGVFFHEAKEMISGIDIYIFVSGLAVLAVSAQGFHRDAIQPTRGHENVTTPLSAEETSS